MDIVKNAMHMNVCHIFFYYLNRTNRDCIMILRKVYIETSILVNVFHHQGALQTSISYLNPIYIEYKQNHIVK